MPHRKPGQLIEIEKSLLKDITSGLRHGHLLVLRSGQAKKTAVYRGLKRLEGGDYIQGRWEHEGTGGPPRRVYRLTPKGRRALQTAANG